jgi:hypothetical protein
VVEVLLLTYLLGLTVLIPNCLRLGGDISFQREKDAKMFEVGPYAERLMGLKSESAKRERLAERGPQGSLRLMKSYWGVKLQETSLAKLRSDSSKDTTVQWRTSRVL